MQDLCVHQGDRTASKTRTDRKGGDLDNAIVINDQLIDQQEVDRLADIMGIERKSIDKMGYVMNKPLAFPNEPARHKLLDVIGDGLPWAGSSKDTSSRIVPVIV